MGTGEKVKLFDSESDAEQEAESRERFDYIGWRYSVHEQGCDGRFSIEIWTIDWNERIHIGYVQE